MELFMECRDILTWSYDEMPSLDLRVTIYHLVVRNRISNIIGFTRLTIPIHRERHLVS
jgi:hypothetical protein